MKELLGLVLEVTVRTNDGFIDLILEIIIRSNDCFIRPYIGDYNEV
jgi:hypothetical protein